RPSSKPKQQDSKQKVLTNTFPPPIPWQKEQITLTLNSQQFHQTQISATSITPNRSHLKSDIEAYLSENDLTASDDVIRISSQKGEMFGRILEERTSESNNRTGQRSIHFLTYGNLFGCIITLGTGCLYNFLNDILLNLVCGLTVSCQPINPNFNLFASPGFLTVSQGQQAQFLIGADFTGGFPGPVSGFSVSNIPPGATYFFGQSSIIHPSEAT